MGRDEMCHTHPGEAESGKNSSNRSQVTVTQQLLCNKAELITAMCVLCLSVFISRLDKKLEQQNLRHLTGFVPRGEKG